MKIAKPYRIIALSVLLLLSFTMAAVLSLTHVAKADGSDPKDYFSYNGRTYTEGDVVFEDDVAKAKLYTNEPLYASNSLAFNDFSVSFILPALSDGDTFSVSLKTPSYYKTGNKTVVDGENVFETEIENSVKFALTGTTLKAAYNEGAEQTIDSAFSGENLKTVTLIFKADSNYLKASFAYDGGTETSFPSVTDEYYMVDTARVVAGKLYFYGKTDQTFSLVSINQKVSDADNKYLQDFVLLEDGRIKNTAYSVVTFPDSLMNMKSEGYVVLLGYKYSYSFTKYSFLGADNSSYTIETESGVEKDSSYVMFNEVGSKTLTIKKGSEAIDTVTFVVKDRLLDYKAPVYNTADTVALESFKNYYKNLLADAVKEDKTSFTIEKAKLYNLVSDEYSSIDTMTYNVKYWYDDGNSSSSGGSISISEAGHYRFIILFTDQKGNAMEQGQFFYTSSNDSSEELFGEYEDYIFEFDVEFDGKLSVTAGSAGTGYKGVKYSSSAFTIEGSNYTTEYKLYYSPTEIDKSADGWNEIVAASKATDEGADYGAFSYAEIKAIGYDGSTSFTPDRTGYYKLECTVGSTLTANVASESVVFEVKEQTKTVTPDDHWLENNVWTVVFLSVGTLSLIGVIILLFIKPKDEESSEK